MQSEISTRSSQLTLSLLVVAFVGLGVVLSIRTHDPHWLNRGGAAIAAAAAGAILWQVRVELRIEEKKKHLDQDAERAESEVEPGPIAALEARLAVKRIEELYQVLTRRRLRVVAFVVACAMLGEVLHGFGDLLMCGAFSVLNRWGFSIDSSHGCN